MEQLGVTHKHSYTDFDGETSPGNGKHSSNVIKKCYPGKRGLIGKKQGKIKGFYKYFHTCD